MGKLPSKIPKLADLPTFATMTFPNFLKKKNFWLAAGLALVVGRGLWLDLMDVDATQYASISLEMLRNGSFLQVFHRHADYLDKPPLLFWASAAAFGAFGVSNWAYKLPSFLAVLAAVWAVYKFAGHFYSKKIGRHAALILASSLGLFLMCNDVRTDTFLMAFTTLAVWQFSLFLNVESGQTTQSHLTTRNWHLVGGAVAVGLAMLAKGPIGAVMPIFAIGTHLILERQWSKIINWRWLAAAAVVAVILAPMCWGLYQQFDLHPEKAQNFRNTSSGLYFFFWEQSFGRITGENVWENDSSPAYFLHTYLWAFLPWSLIFVGALWSKIREAFVRLAGQVDPISEVSARPEWFSMGGFLLTFAALSMSRYKLPHYIFITFPWAAVILARFVNRIFSTRSTARVANFWSGVQNFSLLLVAAFSYLIIWYVFPAESGWGVWAGATACFGFVFFKMFSPVLENPAGRLVRKSVLAAIGCGLVLNFCFYPNLLPFQSTAAAGRWIFENQIPERQFGFFKRHGHALDFYAQKISRQVETAEQAAEIARQEGSLFLFTDSAGRSDLELASVRFEVAQAFGHFQVARLNGKFLNPATRVSSLDSTFLLKILPQREQPQQFLEN